MRQLHGDMRRQLAALNLFQHSEVMIADGRRLGTIRDLLAQLREHTAQPSLRKLTGRIERGVERFSGHEALDGALEEPTLAELTREPLATRGLEEDAACESHAEIV